MIAEDRRDEPGLNFAGDFQIALHDDFIGEFERKQQKKAEAAAKNSKLKFEVKSCRRPEL